MTYSLTDTTPDHSSTQQDSPQNKHTRLRRQQAQRVIQQAQQELSELKDQTLADDTVREEGGEDVQESDQDKESGLRRKLPRATRARNKAQPDESEDRLYLSDTTDPSHRHTMSTNHAVDYWKQSSAHRRLGTLLGHIIELRANTKQVKQTTGFEGENGGLTARKGVTKIGVGLEQIKYAATPQSTHESYADALRHVHAATDYELIQDAADRANINIHDKSSTLTGWLRGTTPARQTLTPEPTTTTKISLAENNVMDYFDDEDPPWQDLREEQFKATYLTDKEQVEYEKQGEWLPRQPSQVHAADVHLAFQPGYEDSETTTYDTTANGRADQQYNPTSNP